MAAEGGRIDFMFLGPPLTRPLDPLLKSIISQQIMYKIYLTPTGKYPTLQSCGIRILVFSLNTDIMIVCIIARGVQTKRHFVNTRIWISLFKIIIEITRYFFFLRE